MNILLCMELLIERDAAKALIRLPANIRKALRKKLDAFAAAPFEPHAWALPLSGRPGVRIRQGDWRAILRVDAEAQTVTVLAIRHRREVYR